MTDSTDQFASAEATLQHIENLHARARKLEELRIEAEEQLLHRLGNAYRAGQLSRDELADIHYRYRQLALEGRSQRWDAVVPVRWADLCHEARMAVKHAPNGPDGTWIGSWPLAVNGPVPRPRTAVIYVLFDAASEPIYLGSTGNLKSRLKAHARDGKPFVAWQAYRASNREAAYVWEDRLLKEHLPPLNKKAGR